METKQVLTTKVTPKEKTAFLYLCTREGIKPAVALHSLVLESINRDSIPRVNSKEPVMDRDTTEERDKATSKKEDKSEYMAMHGITPMKKHEP